MQSSVSFGLLVDGKKVAFFLVVDPTLFDVVGQYFNFLSYLPLLKQPRANSSTLGRPNALAIIHHHV